MTPIQRVLTQPHVAVGAIIEREGKILLVHEYNPSHPDHGTWNQPAGGLELGEDPIASVQREVEEETGYQFTPTAILGVYSLVKENHTKTYGFAPHGLKILFVGSISKEPKGVLAEDISETRWFSPEEIYAMDISVLRDMDIKDEVKDYFSGKRYPLSLVTHTVQH